MFEQYNKLKEAAEKESAAEEERGEQKKDENEPIAKKPGDPKRNLSSPGRRRPVRLARPHGDAAAQVTEKKNKSKKRKSIDSDGE